MLDEIKATQGHDPARVRRIDAMDLWLLAHRGDNRLLLPKTENREPDEREGDDSCGSEDAGRRGVQSCALHMTSARRMSPKNKLCALCTAIPIQALWYRFDG